MDVCTQNQKFCMIWMHFQAFLHLQLAFLDLMINEIVLSLFV
jgi:hypothetical protein